MAAKKATAKADAGSVAIVVPAINLKKLKVRVVGTTPLITHRWSEKAKKEMLDTQTGNKTKAKDKRNPIRDFIDSIYWLTPPPTEYTEQGFTDALVGAKFGFPSIGFKMAAVSAGYRSKITKDKVSTLGAFYVENEYTEIEGVPEMREDMVRLNGGSADLRYRGEFKNWSAELNIVYNQDVISTTELVNLLNYGGFVCGVGEWRVEKEGQFGMFRVEGA